MNVPQGLSIILLIFLLLALAGFYGWRQLRVVRLLQTDKEMEEEDRLYHRAQVRRRLICSGLMVVLAAWLAASFLVEGPAQRLGDELQAARERGEVKELTPEQRLFGRFYVAFWAGAMMLLFSIIVLAGMDWLAIRRYGLRHYRQLQADRRAMIEDQLNRIRSQRNGHDEDS